MQQAAQPKAGAQAGQPGWWHGSEDAASCSTSSSAQQLTPVFCAVDVPHRPGTPPPEDEASGSGLDAKLDSEGSCLPSAGSEGSVGAGCGGSNAPDGVGDWQLILRYAYAAAWLAVLFAGYGLQRAWCACGIPYDCSHSMDYFTIFRDLVLIALFGGALAWFCRLSEPQRFAWLYSWRRWYVWVLYIGLPPVYSAISNAPFAKESLNTMSDWSGGMVALVTAVLTVVAAAVAAQLWLAKRGRGWGHLAAFTAARLAVYAFFAASAAALTSSGSASLHLHHLYLGWAAALWAEHSHWASGLLLAGGAAVFVQGAGAYGVEPVLTRNNCFWTRQADHVACAFWDPAAQTNFTLQVCAAGNARLPVRDCNIWQQAG